MAKASSSSSTASHSPSEQELSDYRSSGISSGTGSPDSRQGADGQRLTAPCQRCQVQKSSPTKNSNPGVDPGLQAELESIKAEMNKANATICALQEREKKMKVRYERDEGKQKLGKSNTWVDYLIHTLCIITEAGWPFKRKKWWNGAWFPANSSPRHPTTNGRFWFTVMAGSTLNRGSKHSTGWTSWKNLEALMNSSRNCSSRSLWWVFQRKVHFSFLPVD